VRRRAALLVVLAIGLLAAPAAGAALLDPVDAEELAGALTEVSEDQDVCYGWNVSISDASGGDETPDVGSSLGPGTDPAADAERCPRWVRLDAFIRYTSEFSENEDAAAIDIASNLERPPTVADLAAEGLQARKLLGDEDDVTLVRMVELLPLFTARNGEAPYAEAAPAATVPEADVPTGTPGDDTLRTNGPALFLAGAAVLIGAALIVWSIVARRSRRGPRRLPDRPTDADDTWTRPDGRTADGPRL
jgi:hypothetical protein